MARNAVVLLLGKGTTLLLSMVTFSFLTRYLGPASYGRYATIVNVVGIAGIVADFSLSTIAVRELAALREGIDRILPSLVALRVGLGIIGIGTATLIGFLAGYDAALIALIAVYSLVFLLRSVIAGSYGLLAQASLSAHWNLIADTCDILVYLAIVGLGIATHQGLGWFVAGALVGAALNSVVIFGLMRRGGPVRWRIDLQYCGKLMRESAPLAVAGLFSVLYFRIDALMLSWLRGDVAVGIYAAAFKFVESSSMINGVLLSALFPVFSHLYEQDQARLGRYYRSALDLMASFSFSLAIVLFIASDLLVRSLSGAAFAEASDVLRVSCGAIVLMFVNNVGAHLLYAARQQGQMVWMNIIALIAKVGVNWLVIPLYGPIGAAAATVATELVITVCVFVAVYRLHGLPSPAMPLMKLGILAIAVIALFEMELPTIWGRAVLLAGWSCALLLIGMPRPRDVLLVLQRKAG